MSRDDFLHWAARLPEPMLMVAGDGQVLAGNPAALETLGVRESDLVAETLFERAITSRESVSTALRLWGASGRMVYGPVILEFAGGLRLRCEGAVLTPTLPGTPARLTVRLKRQEAAVERFLGLNRKIDELHREIRARRQAEAEIRREREWLHVTLSSIGDAVIATDSQGRVEFLNHVAEQLTGWTAAEALGQPMTRIFDIFNDQTRLAVENPIGRVLREGVIVGLANHTVLRARDGVERPIEDSAAPIRNAEGALIGVVMVFRDVSKEHQQHAAMERARDEALAASRAKDDFLAALSHELRTPLNPVLLLATEGAANAEWPADARREFEVIAKNVLLEARLIDDLLDLTRITRGKLSLELQAVEVQAIIRDALATIGAEVKAKSLQLELRCAAAARVRGDAARLQQVFWNLLRNAVKFTPAGGRIWVETRPTPDGRAWEIEVRDTGLGMTTAELERIFEAFSQGDHATTGGPHRFGGLGLGLAITRMLVTMHGGSIQAASAGREQGASFTVVLPALTAAAPDGGENSRQDGGPARTRLPMEPQILLVEDHEPTRAALMRLLTRRKYQVVACGSAASALDLAQTRPFALVISDIGLPDGDGYELMRQLRARHGMRGIALTGYGMERDVARSHAAGFVAHLTKPITVRTLEAALAAALEAKVNGASGGAFTLAPGVTAARLRAP